MAFLGSVLDSSAKNPYLVPFSWTETKYLANNLHSYNNGQSPHGVSRYSAFRPAGPLFAGLKNYVPLDGSL